MILLAGPPGAGKSVQARLLEKIGSFQGISVGKILRENLQEEHRALMERGDLLPDEVVQDALVSAMQTIPLDTKIILDGFPRQRSQIDWFMGYMQNSERKIHGVIHIIVPEEEAVRRLQERGRLDDVEETVLHRYKLYETEILPMLQSLREQNVAVHDIVGSGSIDEVHQMIASQISHLIAT